MVGLDSDCPTCGGSGQIKTPSGNLWQKCWMCDGSGKDPGVERFFEYIFDITLTANQLLPNQRIVVNGDAPFLLKMNMSYQTGIFRARLFDNQNQYLSSAGQGGQGSTVDRVINTCIFGTGTLPFIVVPFIVFPAGGFIGFDLEDLSGANNTIHLAFAGAKLYPTPTS